MRWAVPGWSRVACPASNHQVERTAHSAGFLGCPLYFLLWAAAHRENAAAMQCPCRSMPWISAISR
jgi:hypothetical protein